MFYGGNLAQSDAAVVSTVYEFGESDENSFSGGVGGESQR